MVPGVAGEICSLESSPVGLTVDSETENTEVDSSAWELLVVVDTRRFDLVVDEVRDARVLDGLSAGLTIPVSCTLEAQASAAIAPTNTSVHRVAGGEGNPAHKRPSQK
jgi:hypothetical protein